MKKIVLTLSIILGLSMVSFAQGGLFERGDARDSYYNRDGNPALPGHGANGNQDANETPLGGGAAVLITLGAAYAIAKRRKE